MEINEIIFWGIIGICVAYLLFVFCRYAYLLHRHFQNVDQELKEYKRQKKLQELREMGVAVYYNTKTRTYLSANGREIPELEGTLPDGTPPPTDDEIVPIYINKVK